MTSLKYLVIGCVLLLLTACGGSGTHTRQTAFITAGTAQGNTRQASTKPQFQDIGPLELQAAIMSFADTSNSRIAQAAETIEKIGTPQARLKAARMRVFDISANVEIAAGPYPGIALIDMIVVASLNRMVAEDFWLPRFGDGAKEALMYIKEIEEDIWELAAKVMTPQQMDELATIILNWRKRNPKQVTVNYVRFADFGDLGLKPSMRQISEPGGLFSSVKQAAMVAQDMKVAIDRAFYLMSRMQLIISFQIELAYLEIMFQPEANGLIDQTKQIAGISERYAEIAEKLPEKLGVETSKLMDQLFKSMTMSTDTTIKATLTELSRWQNQTIDNVMHSISKEREAAIMQAIDGITAQQNELYTRVENLLDRSGEEFKENLNYTFMLGLLFMLAFFVVLSLYKIFVARPVDRTK